MDLVLFNKSRDFTEKFCLSDFVMFDNEFYYKKCLEYISETEPKFVLNKMGGHFEHLMKEFSAISVMSVMKCLL